MDVMYGPFSAAYPGNSAGAVVDYVTRMPSKFEAHASMGFSSQPNDLYSTHRTFNSWNSSASLGSRSGDWSFWINLNHTDSQGQPQTFATVLQAAGQPGTAGTPVTGAVPGLNTTNTPWYILGTGTQYHTQQDHAKIKLAYDISPTLRASYTLGWWQNSSQGRPQSYLTGPDGLTGTVKITPTPQDAAAAFQGYADARTAGHEFNSVSILPDELCGYSGQKLMGVLADKPGSGNDYVDRIVHVWTNNGDYLIALQLQGPAGSKGIDAAKPVLLGDFGIRLG